VYPPLVADGETRQAIAEHWKQPRALVDAHVDAPPRYQRITREVAASEGVPLVDLDAIFTADGNSSLHIDWVHPNADGYARIAEALAPIVSREARE
jgi:hypothetical protein